MLKLPRVPLAGVTVVWRLSLASASEIVSLPVAVRLGIELSSVTAPVVVPVIVGASLVPVIVMVMFCCVPSAALTVNTSVLV